MYAYAYDRTSGTMVGMLARPFNEDSDNHQLLESIMLQQAGVTNPAVGGVFILMVDPQNPHPNASWRRRFAETRDRVRFARYSFAVVTPSQPLRGVLTAVNWIRPLSSRFEAEAFSTFDDAVRWIEEKRGQKLVAVNHLSEEVHVKIGGPGSGPGRQKGPVSSRNTPSSPRQTPK